MAHGSCGEQFKTAFSCFVKSASEPKGSECVEHFVAMRDCMLRHADEYPDVASEVPSKQTNKKIGTNSKGTNKKGTTKKGTEEISGAKRTTDRLFVGSRQEHEHTVPFSSLLISPSFLSLALFISLPRSLALRDHHRIRTTQTPSL
jgi:hypothetical protein